MTMRRAAAKSCRRMSDRVPKRSISSALTLVLICMPFRDLNLKRIRPFAGKHEVGSVQLG